MRKARALAWAALPLMVFSLRSAVVWAEEPATDRMHAFAGGQKVLIPAGWELVQGPAQAGREMIMIARPGATAADNQTCSVTLRSIDPPAPMGEQAAILPEADWALIYSNQQVNVLENGVSTLAGLPAHQALLALTQGDDRQVALVRLRMADDYTWSLMCSAGAYHPGVAREGFDRMAGTFRKVLDSFSAP
ncbi:hypothetical protein [Achromobacter pulmonis]|uniref:hypothetical protein n=1 Tax=Achromobacter pulmonis TaxID=1389932 RepID=UPI001F307724|nr:hypothetical protein [Achromobacter pulmonis]MCF7770905.1 hypothetical protein [Achromobacter pulmonis]